MVTNKNAIKTIHVACTKPYDVLIGKNLLYCIPQLIQPVCASSRVVIITDDTVEGLYLKDLVNSLKSFGFEAFVYSFTNGEQSKNINTFSRILEFLAENHIRRNDTLIALGGGVVGDITGFVAAVYLRGVSFIQIPTTLLAAVDSSIGGKTAVDLMAGKNLAGAIWQPSIVICDVEIIHNLPEGIFAEGMAEVIKCNMIKELPIIEWIEEGVLKDHLEEAIYDCIALKRNIVEKDEFDTKGIRNILNAGHTVAHAIEKLSNYTVSHGRAVGTGIIMEAKMAQRLGVCNEETVKRLNSAVMKYNLVVDVPWSSVEITEAMKSDKKNRGELIVFELPSKIGNCTEIKLEIETVMQLIADICGGKDSDDY